MRRLLTLALVVVVLLPTGAAGALAAPNGTATPTPTASGAATPTPAADGGGGAGDSGGAAAQEALGADLFVGQPRFVDKQVTSTVVDGTPTYTARGKVLELGPENFNASNVVRFGVREDAATLKYNPAIDRYLLNSQGTSGTYHLFWVVREGGETATYTANVKVVQANYAHLRPSQIEDIREKAALWEWTVDQFESAGIISPSASADQVKSVIEDAITWYLFYLNPLSALSGQFVTLGLMLVRWPAGWIILGSLFLLYFWRGRKTRKQKRRYERQFAELEDFDEAERRAWERELHRMLSMKSLEDLGLTPTDAQALKEHFDIDNPRQLLGRLRQHLDEYALAGIILQAYHQLGRVIEVEYTDEEIVDARLVQPDGETQVVAPDGGDEELPTEGTVQVLPQNATDEIIGLLDWDELDPEVLWHDDVDARLLDMPINNDADAEGEDLIDALGVPVGEDGAQYHIVERREEFAEMLITVIEHIAASEFTDDEGRIRPEADMLDFMYTFVATGAEKYRWSLWDTRDILLRARQLLDADTRMQDLATRAEQGEM